MHNVLEKTSKRAAAPTRDQVAELITSYAHAIDDMNLDAWPQFFTNDALYHVTTRENHEGVKASRPGAGLHRRHDLVGGAQRREGGG